MSYYIIIRGPLGCGKSTISKKLAEELDAKYICIDEVLEENKLDRHPPDENIPPENFIKANEIIFPEVLKYLMSGKLVIFDACFYYKEVIDHIKKNLDYPGFVFTLKAPADICVARDSKRNKNHGEGAARYVHSMVSAFDYGHIVDVTQPIEDSVKEIIKIVSERYRTKL